MITKKLYLSIVIIAMSMPIVLAQKKNIQVETESSINVNQNSGKSLKRKVAIARFSNETQYGKGIFYDRENDPMAKQALDVLSSRLASTEKFILLERSDINKIMEEIGNDGNFKKVGADYIIVGSITEFGRKNIGNTGVFSRTKTQVAEAGVSIRLIDVNTGMIIYSEEAKGQAELKSKSTLGIGASADYDATLSDKAISGAISKLVENIINNCLDRSWKAYFLAIDESDIYISGGISQGLAVGDEFKVMKRGKSVKNQQTGIIMELPGKQIGKVKVALTGGDNPQSEFSIVDLIDGELDKDELQNYYIEEL